MSKFLLNLLTQISKALVYSKNRILFGKEFSPSLSAYPAFRPSLLFFTDRFSLPFPLGLGLPAGPAHPHGPTDHLSSSSRTEAGRARRHHRLASRRLHGRPDASTGREKRPHLIPLQFSPLFGAIPPLFNPGNQRLQPRH
jgi:hypothetical protein